MFEKISNIFTKNTKKRRGKVQAKKSHYFMEQKQTSLFKKRKKSLFCFNIEKFTPQSLKKNRLIICGSIVLFFTLIIISLLFGPFLKVNAVYVFRQDSIINIDQAYGNIDYIRGKNILFLNTNEIASKLQKAQKSISSIEFDIDFPNHINIHLGSYPAIFQTNNYLILSNGVVISKDSKEYSGIPFLQISESIKDYALFGNTLNMQDLKNLHNLINQGQKNILGFNFDKMKYYITEKELLLMHNSGNIFIFDLTRDTTKQIEKIAIYEKEKGSLNEKKYIYIDVRIPEKLFLCSLESEYDCRNNLQYIYGEPIFEELSKDSSELTQ